MAGTGKDETPAGASRRDFLKYAGVGVGGAAVGGAAGAGIAVAVTAAASHPPEFDALNPRSEPGFDHVVAIMFENRSFDNILGMLYDKTEKEGPEDFEGLNQGSYSNPGPNGASIPAHAYTGTTDEVMQSPQPDPGEHYPHVNTQLFDLIDPDANANLVDNEIQAPYNAPETGTVPTMNGFVSDYIVNFRKLKKGAEPSAEEIAVAMGGFSPEMLPVFSAIARNFAVYDHWFCAVPSQTFCNRSFFHASTSHGFVTNQDHGGYAKWMDAPATPTVFNRLEEAGLSWRVYFDEQQIVSYTGMLHAAVLEPYWKTNFRSMAQFHEDARNGNLPAYAFIEPRMVFNHNDMHPPFGTLKEDEYNGEKVYNSALSDVRAGEALLHSVYSAVRGSRSKEGSNALNTALLITFDEHGGTYDHVPPPSAVPPTRGGEPGEMGFTFDRLGCRVPSILVSAYTDAGTVVHDEMHHGSLIASLSRLHGLEPLTRRDATANPVFNAINLRQPRQPYTWPVTHPAFVPTNPEEVPSPATHHRHRPLSAPAKGLLGLMLSRYEPGVTVPDTYGDAYDVLVKHGKGLFGNRD